MSHDPFFMVRPLPDYKLEEAQRARWAAAERDAEYTFRALRDQVEALEKSAATEGTERVNKFEASWFGVQWMTGVG